MVSKDVNLGTLIPIALFLIVQAGGGIWWASSIHSTVNQISAAQASNLADTNTTNLRQWDRINFVDGAINGVLADQRANAAILQRVEQDIGGMRADLKATNDLLREMILSQVENYRKVENQ